MKAIVIGAGIAGLATAVRLKCKGYDVDVYEANDFAGGKLSEFQIGDYRFDAGPSLFTMPHLVEELFQLADKDINTRFLYDKLDVVCQYFWDDGTQLTAFADTDKYAQMAERVLNVPADVLKRALADSKVKYESTEETFLHKSLHKIGTYFSFSTLKVLANFFKLDILSTMNARNERRFSNPKMVQLFNRYATYNGSNPYKASAILNMIPHLEQNIGAFLPKNGMYDISKSIFELAKELGVQFHFNQPVTQILLLDNEAMGVQIGEKQAFADKIICNMDVFFAYDKLLPGKPKPVKTLSQPKSSSALIFYWGIRQKFEQLHVHNIFFANDYKQEFEHIFETKTISEDVTVYINITSKQCPKDAPIYGENWFVMVNVPAIAEGQNWDALIPKVRACVLKKLSAVLKTDVEALIEEESLLEPRTIQSRTQSHLGALYGTSSNTKMAAFLRHPNFSNHISNLYFCGGSVHPGGGIPLCLLSAKIVSDLVG